jgi:hypothetical protein
MTMTSPKGERTAAATMLTAQFNVLMSRESLRRFPVCSFLPPSTAMAPKTAAVELDQTPPSMELDRFGGRPAAAAPLRCIFCLPSISARKIEGTWEEIECIEGSATNVFSSKARTPLC